jgi:hypothetical protein
LWERQLNLDEISFGEINQIIELQGKDEKWKCGNLYGAGTTVIISYK